MANPPDRSDALRLLGSWRLLQADTALEFAPGARMEFASGGRLHYYFQAGAHRQVVELVYRVEGDTLHTGVPSTAHEQSAHFSFGPGDVLVFDFAGRRAIFIREI